MDDVRQLILWVPLGTSHEGPAFSSSPEPWKGPGSFMSYLLFGVRILLSKTLMIVSTGSQLDPEVFFVNSYETWPVAQKYCRENYVDLVTVTNIKVVEKIYSETGGSQVWIGVHRAPNFFWSDGSNFTFSNWDFVYNMLNSMKVICAVTSSTKGGKWKFLSCEEKLPFVCYSIPHG
uniref:C-type lectin domain-containing protein n=1 Tax=Gouania willdenowi TaxID=441366 RepID=A0A8C5E7A9_GOUWI